MRTSSSLPSFASCGGRGAVDEDEIVIGINMVGNGALRTTRELNDDAFRF
jgi:hypothetical protein